MITIDRAELASTVQRIKERIAGRSRELSSPELCRDLQWLQKTVYRLGISLSSANNTSWFSRSREIADVYVQLVLSVGFFEEGSVSRSVCASSVLLTIIFERQLWLPF